MVQLCVANENLIGFKCYQNKINVRNQSRRELFVLDSAPVANCERDDSKCTNRVFAVV